MKENMREREEKYFIIECISINKKRMQISIAMRDT